MTSLAERGESWRPNGGKPFGLISLVSLSLIFSQVLEIQNLPPNGLQCYSCEGNSAHRCSSEETFLVDCRGPMNRCLEATGTKGEDTWMLEGGGELWGGVVLQEVTSYETGLN